MPPLRELVQVAVPRAPRMTSSRPLRPQTTSAEALILPVPKFPTKTFPFSSTGILVYSAISTA